MRNNINKCLLTFDVEEWFQVENLKGAIYKEDWDSKNSSVVKNTEKILNILSLHSIKATFFVLGWIAEKNPELVRKIKNSGHEIASHGYGHDLTYKLSDEELNKDLSYSKKILEEIISGPVLGYRAPSFSVDDRVIKILMQLGYKYDSSFNPFKLNKRYGSITLPMKQVNNIYQIENNFFEIPVSSLSINSTQIPIGGGAYFRLFPAAIFNYLVKKKICQDGFYSMYLHPWEFEPEQPRIKNIKLNYKIRHYTGLSKTAPKLETLILSLKNQDCSFLTISEYLQTITKI